MPSDSRNTKNGSSDSRDSSKQNNTTSSPANGPASKGKQKASHRSSSNGNLSRNNEQESNERTPLLNRNGQDGGDSDNDETSSAGEDEQGNDDQDTVVSNLGDFTIQPRDLANCLSDKDVDGLLKLGSSNSSSQGNSSKDGGGAVQSLLEALQTDAQNGLSSDQCSEQGAEERIRVYGKNKLPEREMKSFWRFLWEAFCDKVLIILTVAAAVSFALGMWQDFGPQHDPDEPRVNWVEGVAISELSSLAMYTSSLLTLLSLRSLSPSSDGYRHCNSHLLRQ